MNGNPVETLAIDYERTRKVWEHLTGSGDNHAGDTRAYREAEAELARVLGLNPKETLLHNGICYYLNGYGQIQRIHNVRNIDRRG